MYAIVKALQNQTYQAHAFKLVSDMNKAFGNEPFNKYAIGIEKLQNQLKNTGDEINELKNAVTALKEMPITDYGQPVSEEYRKQLDHLRDACCDIQVFTLGGVHFMGMWPVYRNGWELIADAAQTMSWPEPHGPLLNADALETIDGFIESIENAFTEMMKSVDFTTTPFLTEFNGDTPDGQKIISTICLVNLYTVALQHYIQVSPTDDMDSVITGVMSRFVKNEEDYNATVEKHAANGITDVALEGEYPTAILRSQSDQPDAPKGKFLKAASYREAEFQDIITAYIVGMAARDALQKAEA